MNTIIEHNRSTLSTIKQWIQREDYVNSIFNYGLPERVYSLINLPITKDITECDIICYLMSLFHDAKHKIAYLEMGVSVGKTFYQISKYVKDILRASYSLHCLDIEKINPTFKGLLEALQFSSITEQQIPINLPVSSGIIRPYTTNTLLQFTDGDNDISYYEADVFDLDIWKHMGRSYNIIFSDAFHEPKGLLTEYTSLKQNNLIDFTKFAYCFDDLDNNQSDPMWQAVLFIKQDIEAVTGQTLYVHHYRVNSWLGNYEGPHNFGILSNFNFNLTTI